jgi:predicted mannosyl-3-phosphoglycerate phosphatase (HAD superfamily)
MSVEEVAHACRIAPLQASLAKLREYTEAFRLGDSTPTSRPRLAKALRAARLSCVTRGHFDYAGGIVSNALCANLLASYYRRHFGPVVTVALADALADTDLLKSVDHPIVLSSSGRQGRRDEEIKTRLRELEREWDVRHTDAACRDR